MDKRHVIRALCLALFSGFAVLVVSPRAQTAVVQVYTTVAQTLTNKTIGDDLTMAEVAAPDTPASGYATVYAKTDGKLYSKDDAGTEYDLTAGSGAGDMTRAVYDPTTVAGDAFNMANMVEADDAKILTSTERAKLSGIEVGADVTDAANVNAVEADPVVGAVTGLVKADGGGNISAAIEDTDYQGVPVEGAFADGDKTKLNNIEEGATADQTGAEIKSAYEAEDDTNAFTDAEHSKLGGIEAGADVTDAGNVAAAGAVMDSDYTAADEIMVGTGAGTHAQVTLAASQFLAKKAAGAATNVTATEARAILNVADGADVTGDNAPQAHAASHRSGGADAIKLDDLAAPDDNTDLDVSTSKHGLTPKAPNDASKFLRGDATWAVPAGGSGGNWGTATEITINSGSATSTGTTHVHTVDNESDAAVDYLDTLVTTNMTSGDMLLLFPENAARDVWITAAGNITTPASRSYVIPMGGAIVEYDGTDWNLVAAGEWALTGDLTVNVSTSQTRAQIQAVIDALPRNLGGNTLTVQFADGTYTIDDELSFVGFYSGTLAVYGDTSETDAATKHTTQDVVLDSSAGSSGCLYFAACTATIDVRNVRCTVPDASMSATKWFGCSDAQCWYSSFSAAGSSATVLLVEAKKTSSAYLYRCLFEGGDYAIFASQNAVVLSRDNDDTGTAPRYGLYAEQNATIGKYDATQPAGSVANELTASAGVIR